MKTMVYRLIIITLILGLTFTNFSAQNVIAATTIPKTTFAGDKSIPDEIASDASTNELTNSNKLLGPPPPETIQSLSGSRITFDPSAGGAGGYVAGVPTTLVFKSDVYTTDFEWLVNTWLKFPADWTVTNVTELGTSTCDSGIGVWAFFDFFWETVPNEIKIQHEAHMEPSDHCVANYAVDVIPGASAGLVSVAWYYEGDTGLNAATPHYPCSIGDYTPASQALLGFPCDESVNPLAVIPEAVPPVAQNQTVTTPEDVPVAITLVATDADGNPLTYAVVVAPLHGTLSGTAPNLTYTPALNYNGPDSFTFKANNGIVDSNIATVSITVTPINDAPVAQAQSVTTAEDAPVAITLVATDVDGDPLTYAVVVAPLHGTLSGTAPNLTHTPALNYNGPDSFTFKANDGLLDSNIATVSIAVTPVNDAPVAQAQSVTTAEDVPVAITLVATDVDGNPLTYTVVVAPLHGVLSDTAPNLTYTPALNYNGPDSFTFKANDGLVDSNIATVSITVTPVNDAPVAQAQSVSTTTNTAKAITLVATDVDGDLLTYAVVVGPLHGTLSGTAPNLTYTPNAGYSGDDSFTFKANDGLLDSNIATVSISVILVNTAPVAQDQSVTTAEDVPVAITLVATDADGNPLTYAVVVAPLQGTLSGTAPNLTYTPALNYNGPDSFTFKANDGIVDSNIATVSITITPVNDAPVAQVQSVTTAEDVPVAITLIATDVDGDPLTYVVVVAPLHGTLSGTAPNLTYTPALNYNGPDSFTFKANDGLLDSNIATVSITVTPVNDAPVAQAQSVTTAEDVPVAITLVATDVDGNPLTYAVVVGPLHGTLSGTPNLTYTPALNYNGPDSFTFKANDGLVDSNIATVSITVTPVNDVPVAQAQSVTTTTNTATAITLVATDVDGDLLTYAVVVAPLHGTLSGTAPNLTYTPDTGYFGADSFTFKANDGLLDSNIATVSITVNQTTLFFYLPVVFR